MKLVLLKEISALGKAGQTVTVKDGYARNFLIPGGWAAPATAGNRTRAEALLKAQARTAMLQKAKAEELGRRLAGVSCVIPMAVGEQEKLHGAVTAADIAEALQRQGIEVDKHHLALEGPITHLGRYTVPAKLHPEITASVNVQVVRR